MPLATQAREEAVDSDRALRRGHREPPRIEVALAVAFAPGDTGA